MNPHRSYSPLAVTHVCHAIAAQKRLLLLLFLLLLSAALHAQVGIDNPSGPAGIFNGNLEVGVDPYTGNVIRSVADISVAGAVSPLALVRTYNSRDAVGVHFGPSGWRHNYDWSIDPSGNLPGQTFPPAAYVVNFPDGRRETFRFVNWDCGVNPCLYRVWGWEGGVDSSAGVRERFQQLNMNSLLCYLILPDGGKMEFEATRHNAGNNNYYYTYKATGVIDPYGLRTSISYDGNGRINRVTEPGGRYLQFYYRTTPTNSQLIDHITASDGRSVYYYYLNAAYSPGTVHYMELDHVVYYNQAQWTAKYTYRAPNTDGVNGIPLLFTADDPMYAAPMKRVAYQYKTGNNVDGSPAAYGQIFKVRYWDGTAQNAGNGVMVSTLDITAYNVRKETRGDTKWRTFSYGIRDTNLTGHLMSCTDFMDHLSASQTYDGKNYVNSVTDRNGHRTDYTNNPITGNITEIQYPFTHGDTPNQSQRPTVDYTYTNSYYLGSVRDEGNHTITILRDMNNRITEIDYPDGGWETFTSYDGFNQSRSHRMTTGGTETFTFDSSNGRKLTYRNPDNPSGNPTAQYFYDARGRLSGVLDVLSHSTNFDYNDRGQLTVTTLPWIDQQRYTITNAYNPDGTLQNKTDELGQMTSYTYDDYRRLTSVTSPARGDGSGTHTTSYYYDVNGVTDDYKYTDSNVTYVTLPTGKKIKTVYDDNRRKSSVSLAPGTVDEATTGYVYDDVGNVRIVTNPRTYATTTAYDERNRPSSVTQPLTQTTTFTYDPAGRKKTVTRPNGQVITYEEYDAMNRLKRQRVTQTPSSDAVTKYEYYAPGEGQPVGLLHSMEDPRLVGTNSSEKYQYTYDLMGRKAWVWYPKDSYNQNRSEHFTYDAAGRLETFKNRTGNVETFTYDALNRMIHSEWDDGSTPAVNFLYDAASRLTDINNVNATIHRSYWNDDLLRQETESITSGRSKTVSYNYDDDANRASTTYPSPEGYIFNYTYTRRNQLMTVEGWARYNYDAGGNLTTRTLIPNNTHTDYLYDSLDRPTWITQTLNGTSRGFNYGYYDDTNNCKYIRRLPADVGEVFKYDLADQAIGFQLNVQAPQDVQSIPQNIIYDANGNRTSFRVDTYTINNNSLNQYNRLNNVTASYDGKGNLTQGFDGSTYQYDAQNRLTHAVKGSATMDFKYDGLNRQVSRVLNGGTPRFNVWDGWDLIEEYEAANNGAMTAGYVYGTGGLILDTQAGNADFNYYYQDGSGNTSHIADSDGNLLEWYRYDLQGTPIVNDQPANHASAFGVRHLFTGQQWYSDIGLYDLRNRFYLPDIGRFLQPDPSGFNGDANNLYRYSGNNPVTRSDPTGLDAVPHSDGYYTYVAYWPWARLVGMHVVNGPEWLQCAGAARYLGGGNLNGVYYNMPITRYWYQGAMLSTATAPGTIVATGWGSDGRYPNMRVDQYSAGQTINHTLAFAYWDKDGNAHLYSQNPGGPIRETVVNEDDVWQYNEVYVDKANGPYESTPSTRSVAGGNGAAPLSKNEQLKLRGLLWLAAIHNPYWGYLPTTNTTNWAGGTAGLPFGGGSPWDRRNQQSTSGTPNFALPYGGDIIAGGEPGIAPGNCFVAGTPVLMANGSEKPIESIVVGDEVLAWNERTKTAFASRVVSTLHHEEKMQTLFDIELEGGRKFTVNNDHPMYVLEDGDFTFTDELAARFAKGKPITFQNNKNQPVKVVSLQMRREICKMYNLHVEGQGKDGHTYYANGILVHNAGAGHRFK